MDESEVLYEPVEVHNTSSCASVVSNTSIGGQRPKAPPRVPFKKAPPPLPKPKPSARTGYGHSTQSPSTNSSLKKTSQAGNSQQSSSDSTPSSTPPLATPIAESKEMSLNEFVSAFSSNLPRRVVVTKGVYGDNDESTISTADQFQIHFIRHREVVKVLDPVKHQIFSIPINSLLKFSPVFNPNNNQSEAFRGITLPRGSSIMLKKPLPRVVCAVRDVNTGSPVSSVTANEQLVVTGIVESKKHGKKLGVYSITENLDKVLERDCAGHFTTAPSHLKMSILQIIRHIPNPFPMPVVLSADSDITSKLPHDLFTRILILQKRATDVVLVSTTLLEMDGIEFHSEPYEIPHDLDADFKVLYFNDADDKALKAKTEEFQAELCGKTVRHYRYVNVTDDDYQTQAEIYAAIKAGSAEDLASSTERVNDKSDSPKRLDSKNGLSDGSDDDSRDGYELPKTGNRLGVKKQLDLLSNKWKNTDAQLQALRDEVTMKFDENSKQLSAVEERLREQTTMVQSLQSAIESLQVKSSASGALPPTEIIDTERNKQLLSAANNAQVLELLDALGIGQYKTAFEEEKLTGEILVECDEEILRNELGIASRIHQIKLMKLISGKHCIKHYIHT